jgi:hypothetical protein
MVRPGDAAGLSLVDLLTITTQCGPEIPRNCYHAENSRNGAQLVG